MVNSVMERNLEQVQDSVSKIQNPKIDNKQDGLKLFFSFDIVNSSHYKEVESKNWVATITDLISALNEKVKNEIKYAFPWRVMGDEIVFVVPVNDLQTLREDVDLIFQILSKDLKKIKRNVVSMGKNNRNSYADNLLSFKASAWIAYTTGFNRNVADAQVAQNSIDFSTNIFTTYEFYNNQILCEFLGNDIDAGFRISKFTHREHLCVSFELAYILSLDKNYERWLHIMSYKKLKGVWDNHLYPIIWYFNEDLANSVSFKSSFCYDEAADDEILSCFFDIDDFRNRNFGFLDNKMFTDVSFAFEKLIRDNNLMAKIDFLKKYDEKNYHQTKVSYKDNYDEFHLAVVCFNLNKEILVLHRKDKDSWEFGCCKSRFDSQISNVAEDYYKCLGIQLKLITDSGREDCQPEPLAIYSIKKSDKIKKGIIIIGQICDSVDLDTIKSHVEKSPRYDRCILLKKDDLEGFVKTHEGCLVTDFKSTFLKAIDRIEEIERMKN